VYALILGGCTASLLPGERVLGVDLPVEVSPGSPGDLLGAAVAGYGDDWLAAAPGADATWRTGVREPGSSAWVGWWGDAAVRVDLAGGVFVEDALQFEVTGAVAWAAGPHGVLVATGAGIEVLDTALSIPVRGVQSVAWGADRILAVVCQEVCEGRAWARDGAALGPFAPAGHGGAVAEWEGTAWAGAPAWDRDEGEGEACSEDGRCVRGLPGDHLGAAIGGGYVTGTFNRWIVPPRARIVSLGGGETLVLETGAEGQPLSLGGGAPLLIGAPYMPARGAPAGAVLVVSG
jgi:hypothetical protein